VQTPWPSRESRVVVSLSNRVRGEVEEGVPARREEPAVVDEVRSACETEAWAEMR
jgi:hypothetical protein